MTTFRCIAGLVLGTCAALAQGDTAPRLVTLNFAAADAEGRPVTDLTARELQLTDQGKAVPVVAFRNDSLPAPAGAREITNRSGPALSRIQVILFDLMNLTTTGRKPAIDQIVHALEKLESSDAIYLYLLNIDGELAAVRALPAAPPDAKPAAAPWTREVRPMLEQAVGSVLTVRREIATDEALRVKKTYAALDTLGARMSPMPGRKNILWITLGVPCDLPQAGGQVWDCRPTLSQLTGTLDAANVSVSPIALQAAAADPESNVTLQHIVDATGGKFYSGGDIERAIPDAIDLARASYRVEYAPPANNWDGKPHKVRATVARKGVSLFVKQSYTATKAAPAVNEKDRNQALFLAPFDATGIALSVTITPGAQPKTLHLRIGVELQDLLLTQTGDRFTGQLSSYVAAYLPDGRVQEYPALPIQLSLTAEQYEKFTRGGVHLGQDVLVPDGVKKIRLLLADKMAGTSGSVTIPLM
jgi:VWFA-related protein